MNLVGFGRYCSLSRGVIVAAVAGVDGTGDWGILWPTWRCAAGEEGEEHTSSGSHPTAMPRMQVCWLVTVWHESRATHHWLHPSV